MWENSRGSETSFLRLQQLVKSRYGKGVKVLPITKVSEEHLNTDSFIHGQDLYIPIVVNRNYLGTAVIEDGTELNKDQKKSLVETVKMVLETSLYSRWIQRREENLSQITKVDFTPEDNLVLFNDLEQKYSDVSHQNTRLDVRLISNLIHLHGCNDFFIKRVAHQIHELTHRWAFLPLNDLSEIKTVEDLLNLGAVTLFVDELESLSSEKQNLILDYLACPRSSDEPLIITASNLTLEELKSRQDMDPRILEEITFTCFEVDRAPLSLVELREILEMMFVENRPS